MCLEGLNGARKGGDLFGTGSGEASGVDDETGDVIEVRMGDEVSIHETAGDVGGVGRSGGKGEREAGEGASGESEWRFRGF